MGSVLLEGEASNFQMSPIYFCAIGFHEITTNINDFVRIGNLEFKYLLDPPFYWKLGFKIAAHVKYQTTALDTSVVVYSHFNVSSISVSPVCTYRQLIAAKDISQRKWNAVLYAAVLTVYYRLWRTVNSTRYRG